jgi:hypothetical protein
MGAPAWTIRVGNGGYPLTIDMRKLDKAGQRRAIFEVVKHCREAGLVVI